MPTFPFLACARDADVRAELNSHQFESTSNGEMGLASNGQH